MDNLLISVLAQSVIKIQDFIIGRTTFSMLYNGRLFSFLLHSVSISLLLSVSISLLLSVSISLLISVSISLLLSVSISFLLSVEKKRKTFIAIKIFGITITKQKAIDKIRKERKRNGYNAFN